MPGTLNVGGHNIITHSGTAGAGTINLVDQAGSTILTDSGSGMSISSNVAFPAGHVIKTSEYNIPRATYTATNFPVDDTIPQITEGTEVFSQSYTPSSAATNILIRVNNLFLIETSNVADAPHGALFISGDTDAKLVLLAAYSAGDVNYHHGNLSGEVLVPSWSGAKTISVRKGSGHHAVQYFLGSGGWSSPTTVYGLGTCPSATVVVQEIA